MTRVAGDGIVRARKAASRIDSTGVFSIPAYMMRQITVGSLFRAEWHEHGILYRFLGTNDAVVDDRAPDWTKEPKP